VEVDGVNEVLFVPEASRRVLHPLDLGIDGFASRVRDPVPQVRDDVLEPPLVYASYCTSYLTLFLAACWGGFSEELAGA
jgi:hypothetical protein